MNNYITLTKVLLKTSLTSLSKKKSQKWLYLLLVICFIPNLFVTTTMYNDSIQALEPLHQVEYIYSIGLQSTTVVIFIFSAFLIPSIYYFSKDLIHLLPMPITSECIIASKLTVCIIYEYLFCILILGPLFLAFILNGYSSIFFWLMNILVFITLPIYPLMISSILILIIMRFAPFVRRKDIFNIVGSFLLIGISLSFSMLMNNLDDNMMNALLQGGGMLNHLSLLLPHIHFITQVIFNNAYLYIIGYFIVHIIVGTLFILCAKAIYLKAALSIEETNSSRKALTNEQLEKKLKQGNVLKEYTIKELKILLRTPAYILNCVLTELIFPIVMIISFSASGDEFLPYIREYIPYIPNLPAYLCLIALGIGMFASQSSMVTATSISREGKGYIFMKYIPVSLRTILNAKVLSGFIISQIMIAFVLIGFIFLNIDVLYIVISILACEISSVLGNYIGIVIDCIHPSLFWEEEAAAVKRNITGVISMFMAFAFVALIVIVCIFASDSSIYYIAFISTILCLIIDVLFYLYIDKVVDKYFRKL